MAIRQNLTYCPDYFDDLLFWRYTIFDEIQFWRITILTIYFLLKFSKVKFATDFN